MGLQPIFKTKWNYIVVLTRTMAKQKVQVLPKNGISCVLASNPYNRHNSTRPGLVCPAILVSLKSVCLPLEIYFFFG